MAAHFLSRFISAVEPWLDVLLVMILVVPTVAMFTLAVTKAIDAPTRRVAILSALPSAFFGGVVGAWGLSVAYFGYGALFCGNDCAWQHGPTFSRGLALVFAFGAGAGAILGLIAGVLAGGIASQVAIKIVALIGTDGYQ